MESNQTLFSLSIDPVTKAHLSDTARWARFLAVFGIIMLFAFMIITLLGVTMFADQSVGIFPDGSSSTQISNAAKISMVVSAVVITVVTFFPLLFLLRFASRMRRALAANDQQNLNESFLNLKIYFRYLGIVVIIVLVVYLLIFIIGVLAASTNT
jgi:hypothetical protein